MLNNLKARWKVNGVNLVLILTTFALGGSLCGYLGRKILLLTNLDKGIVWVILYIILVTLLWPVCVILISIPLGQFKFFKNYIIKIGKKMSGSREAIAKTNTTRLAVFASGTGTNAQKIIEEARASLKADKKIGFEVALIVCNKPGAGVLDIARREGIATLVIEKENFFGGDHYLAKLKQHRIELIVLAGFLWKLPPALIQAYPSRIINIHPALLPKYGGKGMYGEKVHQAVIEGRDPESGITIHYVDEIYDHGQVIFQAKCPVTSSDTAATLAKKIHQLEHEHYPTVITQVIEKQIRS